MRFWKPRKVENRPLVGISVAAYISHEDCRELHALRCLIASFQSQTYGNWRMEVAHDGPAPVAVHSVLADLTKDTRVEIRETATRQQQFGHPHRQQTAEILVSGGAQWLLQTNQDNYYMPVFLEWMLHEAQRQNTRFVYCDFIRSHKQWAVHRSRPKKGQLDLGAFMAHKDLIAGVKFDRITFDGDGDYINRLVAKAKNKTAYVATPLFVHN